MAMELSCQVAGKFFRVTIRIHKRIIRVLWILIFLLQQGCKKKYGFDFAGKAHGATVGKLMIL